MLLVSLIEYRLVFEFIYVLSAHDTCNNLTRYIVMMMMFVLMNMSILTGFNIAYRRQRKSKIGPQHKISKEEAMKWFQQKV